MCELPPFCHTHNKHRKPTMSKYVALTSSYLVEVIDGFENQCAWEGCRRWFKAERSDTKFCPGNQCRGAAFRKRRDDENAVLRKRRRR